MPVLGYSFENKMTELKNNGTLKANDEKVLRDRCTKFTTILIQQLQQRLPENFKVFEKINMLSPSNVLKQVKDTITPLCKLLGYENQFIEKIDFQWRKINVLLWNETTNVVKFWVEVNNYTDSYGENPLKELSELAITTLSLPFSNAEVERVFSQMNLIKSKTRNKMGTELLTSLLQIRSGLKKHGQ